MKDVWIEEKATQKKKKINIKKIIITMLIIILAVSAIIVVGIYATNEQARKWIDKNVLRKEVLQDNVATIELEDGQESSICTFNRYIGVLNKTKFDIYGSSGSKEKELEIQISNPIYSTENRFLAIAENGGQKIYLINDKDIEWEATVEGNILQIHVNKNGYVAVTIENTSIYRKTIVKLFKPDGTPMINTFLPSTNAIDVSISNDNKYMAIAEVDTSGATIQSNIRIISIDKAEKKSETKDDNTVENTYRSEAGKLITNVKYQDRNKLVCMYTDSLAIIEDDQIKTIEESKDKKKIFQSIDLTNYACTVEEKSSGLFTADSLVNLINISNQDTKEYLADSVAREIYTQGDIIALNLGTEVEFINTNGWLVKKYIANQEITNIVVSSNLAGIIYRDKIEIINL